MASLVGPGNFGQIDVPVPKGGTSVRTLRDSFRIPQRYALIGRDRDGSIKELDNSDIVRNEETINLVPEHEQG